MANQQTDSEKNAKFIAACNRGEVKIPASQVQKMTTKQTQKAAVSGNAARGQQSGTVEVITDAEVAERLEKGSAFRELQQYLVYEKAIPGQGYWLQQSNEWLRTVRKGLTPHARVVFEHLQDNTYWYNWVMVSRKQLSAELKFDEKTVAAAIKSLHVKGVLERVEDADPENWGAGDKPSKAQLDYRQQCWAAWQDLNRISHGKGKLKTLPTIPPKAVWFRVANVVMWRGQIKYMFNVPTGMEMVNRTSRFFSWLAEEGTDPGLLMGLVDTTRKGKAMADKLEDIRMLHNRRTKDMKEFDGVD
jgi:hypothetical protein